MTSPRTLGPIHPQAPGEVQPHVASPPPPPSSAPASSPVSPVPAAHNQRLGTRGEQLAADYLLRCGFRLLARNWRCAYGELDLVMRDGITQVAVEVKTRSGTGFGSPLEAITARKAARLRRLLLEWAGQTGNRGLPLRVDAVGIVLRPGGSAPRIDHLRAIA